MGLFDFFKKKQPASKSIVHAAPSAVASTPIPAELKLPSILHPYWPQLEKTAMPYIKIKATPADDLGLAQSKFGGLPLLPKGYPYPTDTNGDPMFPLAQLNLAEMPPLEGYPHTGLLQFYIAHTEAYGMSFDGVEEVSGFAVRYFEEWDAANAEDLSAIKDKDWELAPVYQPMALSFSKETEYISASDVRFERAMGQDLDSFLGQFGEAEDDAGEALFDTFESNGHKIGGYIYSTQDDPRRDGREDWILLLQIDSQDNHILWGDVGVAHFFIHPDDLRKRDFSKVFYSWDCT